MASILSETPSLSILNLFLLNADSTLGLDDNWPDIEYGFLPCWSWSSPDLWSQSVTPCWGRRSRNSRGSFCRNCSPTRQRFHWSCTLEWSMEPRRESCECENLVIRRYEKVLCKKLSKSKQIYVQIFGFTKENIIATVDITDTLVTCFFIS